MSSYNIIGCLADISHELKRIADNLDGKRSSENDGEGTYDTGYNDGWKAALLSVTGIDRWE